MQQHLRDQNPIRLVSVQTSVWKKKRIDPNIKKKAEMEKEYAWGDVVMLIGISSFYKTPSQSVLESKSVCQSSVRRDDKKRKKKMKKRNDLVQIGLTIVWDQAGLVNPRMHTCM